MEPVVVEMRSRGQWGVWIQIDYIASFPLWGCKDKWGTHVVRFCVRDFLVAVLAHRRENGVGVFLSHQVASGLCMRLHETLLGAVVTRQSPR